MSTQVVRVQGFSKGSLKNIGNEVDRGNVQHRNPDIDGSLSYLNYSYKTAPGGLYAEWNDILTALNAEVRIKKDTIAFEGMVITADKEFFEKLGWTKGKPAPKDVTEFFDQAYEFAKRQVGYQETDRNFLSAKVHYDETTPHLQLYYVPVTDKWREKVYQRDAAGHIVKNERGVPQQAKDEGGKSLFRQAGDAQHPRLSRSEFWRVRGGQSSYRQMQDRFYNEVSKKYGLERGELGSDRQHLTKAQWEQQQLINEKEKLTAEVTPYRELKVGIDRVESQGKNMPLGMVLVKKTEFEALKEQAKAYTANRDDIENLRKRENALTQRELAADQRESEINAKEKKVQIKERQADRMIEKQKDLNEINKKLECLNSNLTVEVNELEYTVKAQSTEINQKDHDYEELHKKFEWIKYRYGCAVIAAEMLLYDKKDGYGVELPKKAEELLRAVSDRAESEFLTLGDKEMAKNVAEKIGIDEKLQKQIKNNQNPVKTYSQQWQKDQGLQSPQRKKDREIGLER